MKVAYILNCFPVLSETFIVREILELQKKYFEVLVFARINTLNHKYSEVIHNDTKKLVDEVMYFPSLLREHTKIKRWGYIILYHLYFLCKQPLRYIQTYYFAASRGKEIFLRFILSVFFARKLQEKGVGHIHVHFALHACTYAMLISKISGISYSFTVHAHDIFIPGLADLVEDKFKNAKFAVCISEYNKQYLLERYPSINKDKIKVIHCGLDLSSYPISVNTFNGKLKILSIGRLVEHKGFRYLIEACRKIKEKKNLEFTCDIIGEGEERQNLEDLISSYELSDTVHLSGSMEQADVICKLQHADLFVLPCVTEESGMQDGIPVVLMEAMAMGIPVISTVVSGVPELVRDGAGILVEQRNAEALSDAITKVMSMNNEDIEIMGRIGRAIVTDHFNIQKEVQKLAEVIAA